MLQKAILLVCLFLLKSALLSAQTDKTFWFVAPEVTQDVNNYDRPTAFKISTFDKAATLTISQPANPAFVPKTFTILANESAVFQFPPDLDLLENTPPDAVLNKGILIESSEDITAYYEVISQYNSNPEIFVLKGRNALGLQFYIPFQNILDNSEDYTPQPYAAFDIVATENNTVINITPTQNLVGHAANVPYSITLNKGQTYSGASQSILGAEHPTGTFVSANKPIAITMKDDLLWGKPLYDGFCRDLLGDQLIPVEKLGKKHVLYKGEANNTERAIVVAAYPNTQVWLDGQLQGTINAGKSLNLQIIFGAHFIETSQPAYVFHLSGINCEAAGALLPSVECSGSLQVRFVKTIDDEFYLTLATRNGNQDAFLLNGQPNTILPVYFNVVPGSNNEFVAAKIPIDASLIATGTSTSIQNTKGVFQMGFFNGGAVTGGRYGYFSDFGKELKIRDTLKLCPGKSVNWHGQIISGEGLFSNLVPGVLDCDTLYNTLAIFDQYKKESINLTTCLGKKITLNGNAYTQNSIVLDTVPATNSCDTIKTYYLQFVQNLTQQRTIDFCPGTSITLNNQIYTKPETIIDTLFSTQNCDTIRTTFLTYSEYPRKERNILLCRGETITIHGILYNSNATVLDTIKTQGSCDTIRVNTILVDNLPPTYFPLDTFWCPGTILTLENPFLDPGAGTNWTPSLQISTTGTYSFSGVNANIPRAATICA